MSAKTAKKTGYDKYINYKTFSIAVAAFVLILVIPMPKSMLDVGVEFSVGQKYVLNYYTQRLFEKVYEDASQAEAYTAKVLEAGMMQGALTKKGALKRDEKWIKNQEIEFNKKHHAFYLNVVENKPDDAFVQMMTQARDLRGVELTYDNLSESEKAKADKAAGHIRICFAMMLFVVICFLTEAMPLPGVAFCIGLILVFSGIVSRSNVAAYFWDDACWFIMGSLMFAAAFVKTGVDKRICLAIFSFMAKAKIKWITAILILVISPAAAFISDHALAAMFLPIAMILYTNSLNPKVPADTELAKMLVITVAMACNVGGFGSPSGGARNVILMTYMEDMFGISIGYGEWIIYAFPFVIVMMIFLWLMINWRFKPKIRDVGPALETLRKDLADKGGWNRKQIIAVVIFLVMLLGWITEKNLILKFTGIRLGIGVIAIAGAVAYLIAGVVNWRDYQEKVDWGVVWLYAGAIIFGKMLASTGTAYWMARSIVEIVAPLGLNTGIALVGLGSTVTAFMTNLMADGPAAACVGPITLNMAAVANPGTAWIPFMGFATACSSSLAYLLVIGTPPNAIVYASGYLQPKDFLRVGIPCFIFGLILLIFMSSVYWTILGFKGMPMP